MPKFYVSHDSKMIIVFVKNESPNPSEETIKSIKLLDIESLEEVFEINSYMLSSIEAASI